MKIALSLGDPNGIGIEITLKSLAQQDGHETAFILLGSWEVFLHHAKALNLQLPIQQLTHPTDTFSGKIGFWDCSTESFAVQWGINHSLAGKIAMEAVHTAVKGCQKGWWDAMVTAPISKKAIELAGYNVPGHTEFIAQHTGCTNYMMLLATDSLRVGLSTIHIPLSEVSTQLSSQKIFQQILLLDQSLRNDFGILRPRIALLGLNPHAGDSGVIGDEEITIIQPAIQKAIGEGCSVHGTFPADGFFGAKHFQKFDAVLAMYHDQGLIPFKTIAFDSGVNVTIGLPIVRTSPDHGTAFDIAGKGLANPQSMLDAIEMAQTIVANRMKINT